MSRKLTSVPSTLTGIKYFSFVALSGQTSYDVGETGEFLIFINGVSQQNTVDYTVSTSIITFIEPLVLNDQIIIFLIDKGKEYNSSLGYSYETLSGNGSQQIFTLTNQYPSNNSTYVVVDGDIQHIKKDYIIKNKNQLIFLTRIPAVGTDNIYVLDLGLEKVIETESNTITYDMLSPGVKIISRRKNLVINGNFDIWQRGTTFSSGVDLFSADRWKTELAGATAQITKTAFAIDQNDVPGKPRFYCSTNILTSGAISSDRAVMTHRVENVTQFSNKVVTLSFWAKADSPKNITTEVMENLGSASPWVFGLDSTTHALTTSWQKFSVTIALPSNNGATGIDSISSSFLQFNFWFSAGSDFNGGTNSLGFQTGTFDIAQVQLEEGVEATLYETLSPAEELALCQRYYEKSYNINDNPGTITNQGAVRKIKTDNTSTFTNLVQTFKVPKRSIPTVTIYSTLGTINAIRDETSSLDYTPNVAISESSIIINSSVSIIGANLLSAHWIADAEL